MCRGHGGTCRQRGGGGGVWGVGRPRGCRSTVPCTTLPSNGDEELLDGGCMACKSVLQLVRRFGGQFGPFKWMIVGPWIHGSLTSILGSNRHGSSVGMHPGRGTLAFTRISDVAGQVGHWATPCGVDRPHQVGPWPPTTSTCLLCTLFVHFCEISCIQIIFPSTSGTR